MLPARLAAAASAAALLFASSAALAAPGPAVPPTAAPRATAPGVPAALLLGDDFPLEVRVSFPAALLHWLDTLTNLTPLTAGKTREAHLRQHRRLLGEPGERELFLLRDWAVLRVELLKEHGDPDPLTLAFFNAADIDAALEQARAVTGVERYRTLQRVVEHFTPLYRRIWRDGQLPRLWLQRAGAHDRLDELAGVLRQAARFYGVDPAAAPHPVLLPVPVPSGSGTHAQALGRFLLIEVRPPDGLDEQVAPIVHENAHYMFASMDDDLRQALAARAAEAGERGERAWALLHEALPTAIAQGEADRRIRRGRWSPGAPWYHRDDVDAYAKRLYPLVREALRSEDRRFDRAFVDAAVELTPRSP